MSMQGCVGRLHTDIRNVLLSQEHQIVWCSIPANKVVKIATSAVSLATLQPYIPATLVMVSECRESRWCPSHSVIFALL